jgi:hypothetical protein
VLAVHLLSDSFLVIEKLASAVQLLDKDDDRDFATAKNSADAERNQESTLI